RASQYIVPSRAKRLCRWRPLSSNVDRLVARIQPHAPLLPGHRTPRDAVAQPAGLQQLPVDLRVVATVSQSFRMKR
ncbi:hypothetical protein, partial [Caldimonas sp.]|uniref:hypothetical protein n=1 Tax=Caldimonas sp. TaxID=2838790 RepID=UPI0039194AF4